MAKDDKPTDGNASQWDKLKAMRQSRDGTTADGAPATPAGGPGAVRDTGVITDPAVIEEAKRLRAGETAGGGETEPETPTGDEGDDEGEEEEQEEEAETVTVREHERKKPEPKDKVAATPPPGTEEVEIDGKKVFVAKELADAYRDSEAARVVIAKNTDRDELVTAVVDRVKELLPKASPADEAAARALAEAEDAKYKHPMPDGKLAVTDPDEYNKQLEAHTTEKAERIAKKVLADHTKETAANTAAQRAEQAKREEAWAREQLGIQFFKKFKVLDDPNLRPLVDVLLAKKFDEVVASGVLAKPASPAEREALKDRAFNDVAAQATKQIVALRGPTGTAAGATAPEPPKLATGAANRGPKKPAAEPAKKPKEKYPTSSVSKMLADHKARKEGRAPAA